MTNTEKQIDQAEKVYYSGGSTTVGNDCQAGDICYGNDNGGVYGSGDPSSVEAGVYVPCC